MRYQVNVYAIKNAGGRTLVHLSNPALYVTYNNHTRVTFADGASAGLSWCIVFKDDVTPFIDNSGAAAGTQANPIQETTGALQVKDNIAAGDYNYSVKISGDGTGGTVIEDPQVIIGGKGGVALSWVMVGVLAGALGAMLLSKIDD
jgi:hypothetical protein